MGERATLPILREAGAHTVWFASAFTAITVWMTQIPIAVYVLAHHSVATLAVITLIGNLPALITTPIAGTLADRYDIRTLARTAMVLQIVCAGLLFVSFAVGLVMLATTYALQGVLNALWLPARQSWIYGIVPHESRQAANASIGSINGLMTLVGAAFGGALSSWQPSAAVAAAGLIQAVACVALFRAPNPVRETRIDEAGTSSLVADLREGLTAANRYPLARSVVWIGVAWGFIGGGYTVLLVGHLTKDLHSSPLVLGAVYVADGLSVLLATAVAARIPRRQHLALYASAYVVQGLAWTALFASSSLSLVLVFLVLMRLASGFVIALDMSILLDTVPDRVRGRVTSLHLTTFTATGRLSLGVLSGVLTVASISSVGIVVGLAAALFDAVWWVVSGRTARKTYLAARTGTPR